MMMQIENHNTESATSEKKQMSKCKKRMVKEKVDTAKKGNKQTSTNKKDKAKQTNKKDNVEKGNH